MTLGEIIDGDLPHCNFLKSPLRHWGPPIKGPTLGREPGPSTWRIKQVDTRINVLITGSRPGGGGGGHLPQVWVSTVKLTPKAVAVTSSGRRAVILKLLFSEAVGHLYRGILNCHYGP